MALAARVVLATVIVPVAAPMVTVVAAPNKLPVNAPVLNTLAVPADVVTILGLAPFMLNVVALAAVMVALRKFNVPVVAPIVAVVAAPNKLPVNALVLNTLAVAVLEVTILGLAPFMLNVAKVVPVNVGLPKVIVPVAAPMPIVVAAPPKLIVVAVVLSSANVVDAVVKLVVIAGVTRVGLLDSTTFVVPVLVVTPVPPLSTGKAVPE